MPSYVLRKRKTGSELPTNEAYRDPSEKPQDASPRTEEMNETGVPLGQKRMKTDKTEDQSPRARKREVNGGATVFLPSMENTHGPFVGGHQGR